MAEGVNLFDLAARISVDTANSDKALSSTQQKVLNLAAELKKTDATASKSMSSMGQSGLSLEKQMAAVASLQRQRSAALIANWKAEEKAAAAAARSAAGGAKATEHAVAGMAAQMLAARNAVRILGSEVGEALPGHLGHAVSQMAYLDSSAGAMSEAFELLASPVGIAIAAIAGIALVGAGSAATLYEFAEGASKTGNDLLSMSQKTGLSVETLQALDEAAKVTGSSLDRIIMSVGMFEKKLTDADGADSRLSRGLKKLGIDTSDANKALGQVIEFLSKFPAGIERTGIAMTMFGRSGKDLAAITDEMKGSLTDYIDEMKRMGEIIGTDDVTAARAFIREQERLGRQWEVIKFQIESAATPIVEEWLKGISKWLVDNRSEIIEWGRSFVSVMGTVANAFGEFVGGVLSGSNDMVSALWRMLAPIDAVIAELRRLAVEQQGAASRAFGLPTTGTRQVGSVIVDSNGNFVRVARGGSAPAPKASVFDAATGGAAGSIATRPINPFAAGGGGGGKGGGKAAKDELDALRNAMISLGAEYRKFNVELLGSANLSALAAEKEKLLADVMRSLKTETKLSIAGIKDVDEALATAISKLPARAQAAATALVNQAVAQFKSNEQVRIAAELTKQSEELAKQWRQEIDNTRTGADEYTVAIQRLEAAYRKYGQTLPDAVRRELQYQAVLQRTLSLTRERLTILSKTRARVVGEDILKDLGGGSVVFRGEATRPRIATVEMQVLREQMEMARERARQLASDLTNNIDNALRTGFERGIKAGLITFAQGILDMIRSAALQALERRLTDMFANILGGIGGGKGGGILDVLRKALPFIGAAAGGAVGAGGSGKGSAIIGAIGKSHATGLDFVPFDNYPALLHRGEAVIPASQNRTVGHSISLTLNYNAAPGENPASRQTMHQLMKQLHAGLAKVQLSG